MPAIGRFVARRLLLGAIAIVENEFDETASVTGLAGSEVGGERESALLEQARSSLPRIPFDDLDVLVVEQMGKDISGVGMDTNVIRRWMVTGLPEPVPPPLRSIVVLDVSDASHGNAIGMGLADFAPRRLVEKIDLAKVYLNSMTAGWASIQRARLPVVLPTDRDAILAAMAVSGRGDEPLRLVWTRDTLHTRIVAVSAALLKEARGRDDLEVVGDPFALPFDGAGRLAPLATADG
jgi:hypothetical protein